MYPIIFSWRKSIVSCVSLGMFAYLMVYADKFYVEEKKLNISENFVVTSVADSDVIYLNTVGLVPVSVSDGVNIHTVKSGESLSLIAAKYGTTVQVLKENNSLTTDRLRVGQDVVVSQVQGFVHTMRSDSNFLVFANQYDLDLEDLMTLNYVVHEESAIQKDQEIFLPMTLEKAYSLGLEEKPKPIPVPVYIPPPVVAQQSNPVAQSAVVAKEVDVVGVVQEVVDVAPVVGSAVVDVQPVVAETKIDVPVVAVEYQENAPYAGKIEATWRDGTATVSNGFYKGFCTYWAARKRPDIFPYVSDTRQTRPFGGNANQWLPNAQAAGFATGTVPAVGALAIFAKGGGAYEYAGHVGVIIEIDWGRRLFLMEEMNGVTGKGYVDHRWISFDHYNISGYIY